MAMMVVMIVVVMVVTVMVVMVVALVSWVMLMLEHGFEAGVVLDRLHQLLHRDLLLRRVGLLDDMADHLVLEDRAPELLHDGRRVLLEELVDCPLLAREAARLGH